MAISGNYRKYVYKSEYSRKEMNARFVQPK